MKASREQHSGGNQQAGRRRLAWLPFTLALVVAALLLTWQRLYFEMQDVRRDALGEAESIMTVIELSRAMSSTDAAPWLTSASSRFTDVVSSSYCVQGRCSANYHQRGSALCSAGDQWDSVCVQSFPRGTTSAFVEVRHSLIPAYQATLRDLLVVSIVALLGLGTWFSAEQRLRQQVLRREDQLRHAARHDALTGLLNRAAFEEVLSAHLSRPKAERAPATLLYLDLDGFKHLNDTHGHHMGDLVLREVTHRFAKALPDAQGSMGRLGGDEFALILPGVSEPLAVAAAVDALTESLVAPFEAEQMSAQLGVSIGAVVLDAEVHTAEEALRRADVAMDEAKRLGHGKLVLFDDLLGSRARRRQFIQSELRPAIIQGQLFLEYQPQVGIDGGVRGVEALVRWRHPRFGVIRPDEFISVAEETGLILPLGLAVIEMACRDLVALRAQGVALPYVSVNVSPRQLADPQLVAALMSALRQHGLGPADMELEVTEGAVMEVNGAESSVLDHLSARGFRIAIDDFGTGYSSLSRLQRMKVDKLKIDRSFIEGLGEPGHDPMLVDMMLALARRMNVKSVAEGVETQQQADWLRAAGCHMIQGYLYAKPMPLAQLGAWMKTHSGEHEDDEDVWSPTISAEL
ncbi:bifunctional diguanylate cyclase/phosphodiesterase [Aquabacterium soli]|uniref:Bifunctional diguanylate cyclase/phosphodiesterase n=1 Tax=Aquabacterium soli TaxID=2493092 RepID=A0A3R8S203_9BURK|nr:bifunctional diguanylate cyclase/phosphodiesterase [Aquabacterium soli]RRS04317.1 bifunctional diguanylate cyclase/phosphodiesterase [Aquabacterium soli]